MSGEMSPVLEQEDVDSIADSRNRKIVPGDALWVGNVFTRTWGVYAGHRKYIRCDKHNRLVVKEELKLGQPFGKLQVDRGKCEVRGPLDRVAEAEAWVGMRFTKGNWEFVDFLTWIYNRQRYLKAVGDGFDMRVEEIDNKLVGKLFEARDKLTGNWYKVQLRDPLDNKTKVYWITQDRESDDYILMSQLRAHKPEFRKEERVMARVRPPHPSLCEATVLNCEGGFVSLEFEDGRKKTIPEEYAFRF